LENSLEEWRNKRVGACTARISNQQALGLIAEAWQAWLINEPKKRLTFNAKTDTFAGF
jgi:hypothetical protein